MADYPICYETISCVAFVTGPWSLVSSRHVAERATQRLMRLGIDVIPVSAVNTQDVRRVVAEALRDEQLDAVVVCGDDCLVYEAVQVVAGTDMPIGLIPTSKTSDLIRQFRLPTVPEAAAELVYEGFTTSIDLGKTVDSTSAVRYFISGACAGLEPSRYSLPFKTVTAAGVGKRVGLLKDFSRLRPARVHIEFSGLVDVPFVGEDARMTTVARDGLSIAGEDGSLVLDREVSLVLFANTRRYDGMVLCPQADHHDGYLDVTVIEKVNRFRMLNAVADFHHTGQHVDYDFVSSYRCKKATISVAKSSPIPAINLDACESILMPVTISTAEAAARFIVPAP